MPSLFLLRQTVRRRAEAFERVRTDVWFFIFKTWTKSDSIFAITSERHQFLRRSQQPGPTTFQKSRATQSLKK